ncbi:MAG: ribose-5-phosphate isomerase RpiA [Thermoplasmata archaeon]|nr:ribose-5-phosphate isomerase RpiA [Thermoplasmata archaeon]
MSADLDSEKLLAATAAVRRVRPGMRIALGTGSTTAYAVRALVDRFPEGGGISAVASSSLTERLARELGLKVGPLLASDRFDVMIDGADEVAPTLDLTKGGGGALFREKFLARLSRELIIMVDHTKLVPALGTRSAIPVEVVPFARPVLVEQLALHRVASVVRTQSDGERPFLTDNGNEILDLRPPDPVTDPARLDDQLRSMPGVVETGLFCGLAHRVFVGLPDGTVQEILPSHPVQAVS